MIQMAGKVVTCRETSAFIASNVSRHDDVPWSCLLLAWLVEAFDCTVANTKRTLMDFHDFRCSFRLLPTRSDLFNEFSQAGKPSSPKLQPGVSSNHKRPRRGGRVV